MQTSWKGSPWGPAAGMIDGHRVTCTWLSPGLLGREERRSNSCPRRAAPQGAQLQGSSLKVPDTLRQWTSFPLTCFLVNMPCISTETGIPGYGQCPHSPLALRGHPQ